MRKLETAKLPPMGDIESREGARGAIRSFYQYFQTQLQNETLFRNTVQQEVDYLYGEVDYTPVAINNGTQGIVAITVPTAQLGYCVEGSYSKSLQGMQASYYVDAENVVNVLLQNNTGGNVTLDAGRFRVYVKPRTLST